MSSAPPRSWALPTFLLVAVMLGHPAGPAAAQIFHEGFEAGGGGWTIDNGVWAIGTATAGPGSCYSGSQCAGTVLGGNYPTHTDSRLISPTLVLPPVSGSEELHLRFRMWFSYSTSDSGQVQIIDLDGGEGWQDVGSSVSSWSNGWSLKDVPLTAYAGKRVQIRFAHTAVDAAGGGSDVSTGWYIDEIEFVAKVPEFTGSFEGGWGDWGTDRGVWQVGTPTAGPSACYSGSQCAGTVLSGNYPTHTDSRLISPTLVLPPVSGSEELHLRFRTWFSYSTSDSGQVQIIDLDGGEGWQDVGSSVSSRSNGWSLKDVPLTAYAGKRVQIRFWHGAIDAPGGADDVSTGWYIDEIEFVAKVPEFTGSFEGGWGDWGTDRGVWQVGTPTAGPGSCYSGSQCAGTVLGGNYPTHTDSRLISPTLVLPPVSGSEELHLRFRMWFSYSTSDSGQVQIIDLDGGEGWQDVGSSVSSWSNGWSLKDVPLTAYAGKRVQIRFAHTAVDAAGGGSDVSTGWYIDEIEFVAKVPEFTGSFEGGWGDWGTDKGVWQVGTPTAGPGSCYSGSQCAGTVLGGNYPTHTDSRLISPTLVLPPVSGAEELHLRFRTWFSYSTSDSGQVQIIDLDGGEGWQDVGSSVSSWSNGWSLKDVPLTAYAGKRVQIRFAHTAVDAAGGGSDVSTGWYIDEIEFVAKVPEFTGSFEGGWGDWGTDKGVWQVGTPTAGPGSCYSGSQCAGTVLSGNYPTHTDSRLISPTLVLPPVSGAEELHLRFRMWFSYSTSDSGQVQIIDLDGGEGWQDVGSSVSSWSNGWSLKDVPLTAYAGKRVQIRFAHTAVDAAGGGSDVSTGWYIDEIEFVAKVPEFTGSFEGGWGDWGTDKGVWQVGTPTAGPGSCYSGSQCAGTVLGGNYPTHTDSRLISPTLVLPPVSGSEELHLRFRTWFSYSTSDSGQVQIIDLDGGEGWQDVGSSVSSWSNGWLLKDVPLTAHAGKRVQIRFAHTAVDAPGGGSDVSTGWYIDEIELPRAAVPPNRRPVVSEISNQQVVEDEALVLPVLAMDPDGRPLPLSLAAFGLPYFATFVDQGGGSGSFTFSPDFEAEGEYQIRVEASDGELVGTELFTLTVTGANRPPQLAPIPDQEMYAENELRISLIATDPDGDPLSFDAVVGLPSFCSQSDAGDGTGSIDCEPSASNGGTFPMTVTVRDAEASASAAFSLVVDSTNPPNLAPSGVQIPAEAVVDQRIPIGWTSANQGLSAATGSWQDCVYLSTDEAFGGDTLLGCILRPINLEPAGSYLRFLDVTVPDVDGGEYWIAVKTDDADVVSESNEDDNVSLAGPLRIRDVPCADVEASGVVPPTDLLVAGGEAALEWVVTNVGEGPTNAPFWFDRIYLSEDLVLDGGDVAITPDFVNPIALNDGDAYAQNVTWSVPDLGGTFFVLVRTDARGNLTECDEENNVAVAPTTVEIEPAPVSTLTAEIIEALPTDPSGGDEVLLRWTLRNNGNAATGPFSIDHAIGLVQDDGGPPPGRRVLSWNEAPLSANLIPGETTDPFEAIVTIPRDIWGAQHLYVWPDPPRRSMAMSEPDWAAIEIREPPPSDLAPTELLAPASALAGQEILIEWTVENEANSPTLATSWRDDVIFSEDADLETTADNRLMRSFTHGGVLKFGESYTASRHVRLANDASGTYHVFVCTDAADQVFETDETDNCREADGPPLVVEFRPPDLETRSVAVSAPAFPVLSGTSVSVDWTVGNTGSGPTAGNRWTDRIYLSTNASLDGSDTVLATTTRSGALPEGGDYSAARSVTIPVAYSAATAHVIVCTDSSNQVFESDDGNNCLASEAFAVAFGPAELGVSSLTVELEGETPSSVVAGSTIDVLFEVQNTGPGATSSSSWVDRIYLSSNAVLDSGDHLALTVGHAGVVASGDGYSVRRSVRIPPQLVVPALRVIVVTDATGRVFEADEGNNATASAPFATVWGPPDLVVEFVAVQNGDPPGEVVDLTWRVRNRGGPTFATAWFDRVFLSTDRTLSEDDVELDSVSGPLPPHVGALANQGSYTRTESFAVPAGSGFLIVVTDGGAPGEGEPVPPQVPERNEFNNAGHGAIPSLECDADLRVESVRAPESGISGQVLTIEWDVANRGSDATNRGSWRDAIFLSRDPFLDLGTDLYAGEALRSGALAAEEGYAPSASFEIRVPAGLTGAFYVFVVANNDGAVCETDPSNNSAFDPIAVEVELPPPTDLVVESVSVPDSAMLGGDVRIDWVVRNASSSPALGIWHDALYLSKDAIWDVGDVFLGDARHVGTVGPSQTYAASLSTGLPGVLPGDYYVILRTDSRNEVREEGGGEENNLAASTTLLAVTVRDLVLGTPDDALPLSTGSELYYRIDNVPVGQDLQILLDVDEAFEASTVTELFVRFEAIPDRARHDFRTATPFLADHEIVIPSTRAGAYFVLVRGASVPDEPADFALTASLLPFEIRELSPSRGGNVGEVTTRIEGAQLTPGTTIRLVDSEGETVVSGSAELVSSTVVETTFDLSGVAPGAYDVVASRPDLGDRVLPDQPFMVTAGVGGELAARLVLPRQVRPNGEYSLWVEYENVGDTNLPAPLFVVTALQDTEMSLIPGGEFSLEPVQLLGIGFGGPASIIRPGALHRIPVRFRSTDNGDRLEFLLEQVIADDMPVDWESVRPAPPPGVSDELWETTWRNFVAESRSAAAYQQSLREAADHLAREGGAAFDVAELFPLLLHRAAGAFDLHQVLASSTDYACPAPRLPLLFARGAFNSLPQRVETGPFGRSWSHNFEQSLSFPSPELAHLRIPGGFLRVFRLDSFGVWIPDVGASGRLEALGSGGYLLSEKNGVTLTFAPDGSLIEVAEPNGNRLALRHAGGLLREVRHGNGCGFDLDYDAAGRIVRLTDQNGRTTDYAYQTDGETLTEVVSPGEQTTRYTYVAPDGGAADHALESIRFPDGSHRHLAYDELGRLAQSSRDLGSERLTWAYGPLGRVVLTDAFAESFALRVGEFGEVQGATDPLGRRLRFDYDTERNLTELTQSDGSTYRFTYEVPRNLVRRLDPLGNAIDLAYEPLFNRIAVARDARLRSTAYTYDADGNLESVLYPDLTTSESFVYDSFGNLERWANRRNQVADFEYDERGLVVEKETEEGLTTFTYDERGNLRSAVDAAGETLLDWNDTDQLTRIEYPTGRWLELAYEGGRRSRLTASSGLVLNYLYDAAGRLQGLADAADLPFVTYAYDAAGRLERETRRNGTEARYEYDAAGQVRSVVHTGAGGALQERLDYDYDERGRPVSVSSLLGTWSYGYDRTGQLTLATFSSPLAPGGDLSLGFTYDESGNRSRVTLNAIELDYAPANALNQYELVGGTTYGYDDDGNLSSRQTGGDIWDYHYDSENRLVRVDSPEGVWRYEYDALGNRVASLRDGVRTEYLLDPTGLVDVVGEFDASGSLVASYLHGLGLVGRLGAAGDTAFYGFDAVGNSALVTTTGGEVANRYIHSPFGRALAATETIPTPFRFGGQLGVMDEGNGLHFMRARHYDAGLGRFLQVDPIGFPGGDINPYRFVHNRPTSLVDPEGLELTEQQRRQWARWRQEGRIAGNIRPDDLYDGRRSNYEFYSENWGESLSGSDMHEELANGPLGKFRLFGSIANLVAGGPSFFDPTFLHELFLGRFLDAPTLGPLTPGDRQERDQAGTSVVRPIDPNDKLGPDGFGDVGFVPTEQPILYTVNFENLETASAAARRITITDVLSQLLDIQKIQFAEIAFGETIISFPEFPPSVGIFRTLPNGVRVRIDADFDPATNALRWSFEALDAPRDPMVGIIPPNDESGAGEGHVQVYITPRTVPSGSEVSNLATIQFDSQGLEVTDPFPTNALDSNAPSSIVDPLVTPVDREFTVSWRAIDEVGGSGIGDVQIWYRQDRGPYQLWLTDSPSAPTSSHTGSAVFSGEMDSSYDFRSRARDNAGNWEKVPLGPDASTVVGERKAMRPSPAHRSTNVSPSVVLTWEAGFGASSHDLFFWDCSEPQPGAPSASGLSETSFAPGPLDFLTTYCWQVVTIVDELPGEPFPGDVWEFTTYPQTRVSLATGFNLFAYPGSVPEEHDSCRELVAALGAEVESISRLDASSQTFQSCTATGGSDFPIVEAEGYVIRTTGASQASFAGPSACPEISLRPGQNLIGHMDPPSDSSCFDLLRDLGEGTATSVQRFDSKKGRFEACFFRPGVRGAPEGEDFPIRAGDGYMVSSEIESTILVPCGG